MKTNKVPEPNCRFRLFKNEKIERIAKKNDSAMEFMNTPLNWKINNFLSSGFKLTRGDIGLFLSAYCLASLSAFQVEQQAKTEVPEINIVNNQLFVDDKEMLASDFVEKYCFAKRDNQTCVEAVILKRQQNRATPAKMPTNW
jgi:hypothetical protein